MTQMPLLPPAEPVFSLKITVPGDPVPKGRHRARIVQPRHKPAFIHFYQDSETEKYENHIAMLANIVMGGRGVLLGPLELRIIAYVPIPKSWSEKMKQRCVDGVMRPVTRPDGDNYEKAALDALNGIVYKDDAQIVEMRWSKRYDHNPRLEIEVFAV